MEDYYIECFDGTLEEAKIWWLGEFESYLKDKSKVIFNFNYVYTEIYCPKVMTIAKSCHNSTEFKIKLDLIGYNYDKDDFISGIISLLDKYRHGKK